MTRTVSRRAWRPAAVLTLAGGWFLALMLLFGSAPSRASSDPLPVGWSQGASLPGSFQSRWNASFAYFPPADSVVLFGGAPKLPGESYHNDTWVYRSDDTWAQGPSAPSGLTPRGGAAMAYDPDIGKIVLFGGQLQPSGTTWEPTNETWLYDGSSWEKGPDAPAELAGRSGARMVYDPDISRLVLFGGSGLAAYTDTWLFDGSSWTQGPAAPTGMGAREFFGMTYDPDRQSVVVAGGTGGTDVWEFDGSTWSAGPPLPADEPKEHFALANDPQLGGDVYIMGPGPGQVDGRMYILRSGGWSLLPDGGATWPSDRLSSGLLWHPGRDALMLVAGIADDFLAGTTGLSDTWFFRDVAPQESSVTLSPTDPTIVDPITMTMGGVQGGFNNTHDNWEWYVNDVLVPDPNLKLDPGAYTHGDIVRARVKTVDSLGLVGPWVWSNPVTVVDRAPSIRSASISPMKAYPTTPIQATASQVNDPDGDTVTLDYNWRVNGVSVGLDDATLPPSYFQPDDSIKVTITPVDSVGMSGDAQTSAVATVSWNITAGSGSPGKTVTRVLGGGFGSNETVTMHFDSPTGPIVGSGGTDSTGAFSKASILIPSPVPGGPHIVYGVGAKSGLWGTGSMTVVSSGSLSPLVVGAGDGTVFGGLGFAAGETVSVGFPGASPVTAVADANGSMTVNLVSPPEPADGGNVTAAADSGTVLAPYTTKALFTAPATAEPWDRAPIALTGFGANETVNASFDGGGITQAFTTDASGSFSGTLLLDTTFGHHSITMKGVSSSVSKTDNDMNLPAFITVSPSTGPVGTQVVVTSGPGWVPGKTVHLYWKSTVFANPTADATGAVIKTFTIPKSQTGPVTMKAKDDVLLLQPSTTFTVKAKG